MERWTDGQMAVLWLDKVALSLPCNAQDSVRCPGQPGQSSSAPGSALGWHGPAGLWEKGQKSPHVFYITCAVGLRPRLELEANESVLLVCSVFSWCKQGS